jgi:hypothetical protein
LLRRGFFIFSLLGFFWGKPSEIIESNLKMDNQLKIYLIGSFHNFRDRIIGSLPGYSFSDPRTHHQANAAKMVVDDMTEAENCPVALAVFPKGKSRGVMSYSEIGASIVSGNTLITVDEDENSDPLLKKLTLPEHYFTSLDSAIEYLASEPKIGAAAKEPVLSKYPPGTTGAIPLKTIYFCGTIDRQMMSIIEEAVHCRPDKTYIPMTDPHQDFLSIADYDLIVANFPKELDWDRHACLMLGAAYSHDISTIVMDRHEIKYPPLQALARRQMEPGWMFRYITEVDDLKIDKESATMYNLFMAERENKVSNLYSPYQDR